MKRFFVIAVAVALSACMGNEAWSQGGQGGGGGAAGGAGTSGGAGAAGAAGGAGTSGAAGTAGTAGTAGNAGAAGTPGTAGSEIGTAANPSVSVSAGVGANAATANQNRAAANANVQQNANFNGFSQTPFFTDPGARQQLRLNNTQFNQLNRSYQQSLQRFNRDVNGLNAAGDTNTTANGNANRATRNAQRRQQLQARANANANTNAAANAGTLNDAAARERALRMQEFQNRFATEFNRSVDSTLTDPALRQRFNQLRLQHLGFGAFNDPTVQQQLNVTPQQRQQLSDLEGQWRQQLRNVEVGNRSDLTQEQFNSLRTQFRNQLDTVLTPAQRQEWTQLTGEPYDFPFSAFVTSPRTTAEEERADFQQNNGQTGTLRRRGTSQNPQNPRSVR